MHRFVNVICRETAVTFNCIKLARSQPFISMSDGNEGNVENKSIHAVQSVPVFSSAAGESSQREGSEGSSRKAPKSRRVSFASSKELTQYLEPINPFETLGKFSS